MRKLSNSLCSLYSLDQEFRKRVDKIGLSTLSEIEHAIEICNPENRERRTLLSIFTTPEEEGDVIDILICKTLLQNRNITNEMLQELINLYNCNLLSLFVIMTGIVYTLPRRVLQELWIHEAYGIDITFREYLSILENQDPEYLSNWDFTAIRRHIMRDIVTVQDLIDFPNYDWDYKTLSISNNIPLNFVIDNYQLPWDKICISRRMGEKDYKYLIQKLTDDNNICGWSIKEIAININPELAIKNDLLTREESFWRYLSSNTKLTISFIKEYNDRLDWKIVSRNSAFNWETMQKNSNLPWIYPEYARNKNLTWDIIYYNPKIRWNYTKVRKTLCYRYGIWY